jgi:hypothetical protein
VNFIELANLLIYYGRCIIYITTIRYDSLKRSTKISDSQVIRYKIRCFISTIVPLHKYKFKNYTDSLLPHQLYSRQKLVESDIGHKSLDTALRIDF